MVEGMSFGFGLFIAVCIIGFVGNILVAFSNCVNRNEKAFDDASMALGIFLLLAIVPLGIKLYFGG